MTDSLPGTIVASRYRLVRELGSGGMGTVFEARDESMGRAVAVKLLRREVRNAELLARFEREAFAAAKLHHPNIVGVHELAQDEDQGPAIVMELLRGTSLDERLAEEAILPATLALEIAVQILDGLIVAHENGVVHRDLKPSNVFLVPLGASSLAVKLLDFGVAKLLEEDGERRLTRRGTIIGTPAYMSPEQASQDNVDARTDLYAVGACLYEMLAGRRVHDGDNPVAVIRQLLTTEPRDLGLVRPDLPLSLVDAVRRALARQPDDRWETAREMRAALAGLLASGATADCDLPPVIAGVRDDASRLRADERALAATVVVAGRPRPRVRAHRTLGVVVGTAIALGIGGGVLIGVTHDEPRSELSRAVPPKSMPRGDDATGASVLPTGVDPPPPASATDEPPGAIASSSRSEAAPPAPPAEPGPPAAHTRPRVRARRSAPESAPREPARIGTDILNPF